jgi:hypothetical protein
MQFDRSGRTAGLTENNFRSDNRGGPGRRSRLPFVCAKLQHDIHSPPTAPGTIYPHR